MARSGRTFGFIGELHVGRFVVGEFTEALRLIGATVTTALLIPMTLGTIVLGRWSATGHYGRAISGETRAIGSSLFRMAIVLPSQLLMITPVAEGIGQRLPAVVKAAPGRDTPPKRTGQFDGYEIVGSLKGGGSGGKLYIAEPDEVRLAGFERQGHKKVDRVVIKVFSLKDGSSLPQIVRESRALDAAKKLGLVLDHELTHERFHYVMRYVPGDSLGLVTQRLHAISEQGGLDEKHLKQGLGFVRDLLETLSVYHSGGLWHKDVKPDNIIVDEDEAHVVDLGLVTPLRSAMTLTTHGTEYFRDPELVRMALKGVKVHQVDGAKFDIYAAGAVLYSVVENSFPAHGGLSQVTKRCPDTVRWIIRRAMADYDKRYETAAEMLADLRVVMQADDPFAVKPADLPSVGGEEVEVVEPRYDEAVFGPAGSPAASRGPAVGIASGFARTPRPEPVGAAQASARTGPKISIKNWWTGRYEVTEPASAPPVAVASPAVAAAARARAGPRRPASEQLEHARARAAAARERAQARRLGTRPAPGKRPEQNSGVLIALVGLLVLAGGGAAIVMTLDDGLPDPAPATPGTPSLSAQDSDVSSSDPTSTASSSLASSGDVVVPAALTDPGSEPGSELGSGSSDPSPPPAGASAALGPIPGAGAFLARLTGTGLDAALADRVVLVVSELEPPLNDDAERYVRAAITRVASTGLAVIGDPLDRPGDAGGTVRELQAGAIVARRQRPLGLPTVNRDMSQWIGQTTGVNYILWIEPNAQDPGEPYLWLFKHQPRGTDGKAISEAMINGLVEQLIFPAGT